MEREPAAGKKPSRSAWNWVIAGAILIFGILVFRGQSDSKPRLLNPPNFEDISNFGDTDFARIDTWLQERVEVAGYPGLSVAIVRKNEILYQRAFGFADIETTAAATPDTAYHVASVSKAFTATMAAILHEQGVIDLDEPVSNYLPHGASISRTPEIGKKITFRQLAAHMSGLPRGVPKPVQSVHDRYQLEPKRLYGILAEAKLDFEPGTDDRYSNLGYGLLGHALELAAGKPFEQLMQELVCEPLSLKKTTTDVENAKDLAAGYSKEVPRKAEGHSRARRLVGSGGVITSAPDLARFLSAHMTTGAFSLDTISECHAKTKLLDGSPISRTLIWSRKAAPSSGIMLQKNGGRNNCKAWVGFSPTHQIGVAVISNCGDDSIDSIGYQLLERSIPGGAKVVSEHASAKVSPWTGVHWKGDTPVVQVNGDWSRLKSVDGIAIKEILEFAKQEYLDEAQMQMRIAEDLVEVLTAMGHQSEWSVTLGLEKGGNVEEVEVRMTEENREVLRD